MIPTLSEKLGQGHLLRANKRPLRWICGGCRGLEIATCEITAAQLAGKLSGPVEGLFGGVHLEFQLVALCAVTVWFSSSCRLGRPSKPWAEEVGQRAAGAALKSGA